jgi:transposase
MLRRQAFQFALMPNGTQLRMLRRFVFNRALALQEQQHEDGGKFIRYEAMASHLVAWKKDPHTAWLQAAPALALQQALMHLDHAYQRCFDQLAARPRVKKRGQHDGFRLPPKCARGSIHFGLSRSEHLGEAVRIGWRGIALGSQSRSVLVLYAAQWIVR